MCSDEFRRLLVDLIKMTAPFAPLYSMECWSALQTAGVVNEVSIPLRGVMLLIFAYSIQVHI